MSKINNTRIKNFQKLISPNDIRKELPVTENAGKTIEFGRRVFTDVLDNKEKRFIIITGPCSIHNKDIALEYADRLIKTCDKYKDKLSIFMRVYFEKPRTSIGWKGLINDPYLDDSNNITAGLKMARKILIDIAEIGIPTATELLDPITAAYICEVVSWAAIGARTTESQTHRQMVSGLSVPVGFKNNKDGNIDVAVNAILSAKYPHSFLGVDDQGHCSIVNTEGNSYTHVILRGGASKPNYHIEDIEDCEIKLEQNNINSKILIDCSHDNSRYNSKKQKLVVRDIIAQKRFGNESIFGIMLESNLYEGRQKLDDTMKNLQHGVSITDSCIGWAETEELINFIYESI